MESQPSSAQPSPAMTSEILTSHSFVESLSSVTQLEPNNIMEVLSRMIYGSNMISKAGGSLSTTYRICYAVFQGQQIPEQIAENDFEYKEIREHMEFRRMRDHMEFRQIPVTHESILQSYRETVQHAEATKYLITKIVLQRQSYDGAILQEANGILTHNIHLGPRMSWASYGGYYRPLDAPRNPRFLDPAQISSAMLDMINELTRQMGTQDMSPVKQENVQERIWNACRFCHRFILIHPFMDGNGRMYRLFLTTLLLRAGLCPPVYGLYNYDRIRHWPAETSCYMQDNQVFLSEADLVAIGPSQQLVIFVNDHMYLGWKSPDEHMGTFRQVTGQAPYNPNVPNMGPQ
ncbi:hypothetical protein FPCIR_1600 [Fusarium pseudocircinatum]|uniref:Fido domain-containing protein n=1 Tax=Fusarium pseudocircinatum TaxID=56676 RepID=A0A8H5PU92_9HYPO|nr:hypothetical protein FPCIR_1600 [Fusarium pseudocircinatum]